MRDSVVRLGLLAVLLVASTAACQLGDALVPTPSPTPTKTLTPTAVPTATVTPAPTITADPWNVVPLPHPELILFTLSERYESFSVVTGWGVGPDTKICIGFEAPAGSGNLYMAVYALVDGRWALVEIVDIDSPSQVEREKE